MTIFAHKSFDNDEILLTQDEQTHKLLADRIFFRLFVNSAEWSCPWTFFFRRFLKYGGELVFAENFANFAKFVTHKSFGMNINLV